jgi:UDP-N-acetylmuramoylalanine--D-glutamate ligase
MIVARSFAHQDVGVFGLARSGIASVRSLNAGAARVYAWDDKESARLVAEAEGAQVLPWRDWPWDELKALVLSPGVPLTHPAPHDIVAKSRASNTEVIGDIELPCF